jgi:hypothetical protein
LSGTTVVKLQKSPAELWTEAAMGEVMKPAFYALVLVSTITVSGPALAQSELLASQGDGGLDVSTASKHSPKSAGFSGGAPAANSSARPSAPDKREIACAGSQKDCDRERNRR